MFRDARSGLEVILKRVYNWCSAGGKTGRRGTEASEKPYQKIFFVFFKGQVVNRLHRMSLIVPEIPPAAPSAETMGPLLVE